MILNWKLKHFPSGTIGKCNSELSVSLHKIGRKLVLINFGAMFAFSDAQIKYQFSHNWLAYCTGD
jgi:hypothetical protein